MTAELTLPCLRCGAPYSAGSSCPCGARHIRDAAAAEAPDRARLRALVGTWAQQMARLSALRGILTRADREAVAEVLRSVPALLADLDTAEAEVARLRAGGCARDQSLTSYCPQAEHYARRVETVERERDEARALAAVREALGLPAEATAAEVVGHAKWAAHLAGLDDDTAVVVDALAERDERIAALERERASLRQHCAELTALVASLESAAKRLRAEEREAATADDQLRAEGIDPDTCVAEVLARVQAGLDRPPRCRRERCYADATHGPDGEPVACWGHAGEWPEVRR